MTYVQIILVGNVGRNPELRFTQNGAAVCDFSLAVNRSFRRGDQWDQETTWFRVTFWGEQAERINQTVQKGQQMLVVADRVEANAYTTRDGRPAASIDVTGRTYRLLGRRDDSGGGGQYQDDDSYGDAPTNIDDIPF